MPIESPETEGCFIYVVGHIRGIGAPIPGYDGGSQAWELGGVFATVRSAEAACRDFTYFVAGPFRIGERMPHETVSWPAAYFPIPRTAGDPLLPGESA